ncbi:hypothetical protein IVB45_02120 [Bradyrhizobium sp. 4]|uniref:helix-turn-helix domain-containing protein n=1 Tax=Bradyrhizobium sp. 4 TaxID=2782678 RepID=UPI001FFF0E52|nr:helix-turn-helix domain-containing protein [Bradyrhizobium sp. 4]UPJ35830.1 hypothetical protein IVB45_02120 [Bradyrhizobium sp. 4]
MKNKLSQLERIRARLHDRGMITRNECLRNFITRCAARIIDLEKQDYVFRTEETGADFIYYLVSINGVTYLNAAQRAQMLKENDERLAWFDNYQTPAKV